MPVVEPGSDHASPHRVPPTRLQREWHRWADAGGVQIPAMVRSDSAVPRQLHPGENGTGGPRLVGPAMWRAGAHSLPGYGAGGSRLAPRCAGVASVWVDAIRYRDLLSCSVSPVLNCCSPSCSIPAQACAPLYSWRTLKDESGRDPVGTCYLSVSNFTKFVEYSPCRSGTGSGKGGKVLPPGAGLGAVGGRPPNSLAPPAADNPCFKG